MLDLRYDGGGDYTLTSAFAHALPKLVRAPGRIALITGPDEFSAGITTAAFVKDAGGARVTIVGEPVGDRLSFWSEGGHGCLPHAQAVLQLRHRPSPLRRPLRRLADLLLAELDLSRSA